ncbi:hypothetical protein GcM1_181008, partial [Golovinomyces cichoracearum]
IWQIDATWILKKFIHTLPESDKDRRSPSRLIRAALKDTNQESSKDLSLSLHQLSIQNKLLGRENSGLKESLNNKKKRKKHVEALDFKQSKDHDGVVFYFPHAVRVARDLAEIKQRDEEE